MKDGGRMRRALLRGWGLLAFATFCITIYPISHRTTRLFVVLAIPVLCMGGVLLIRRRWSVAAFIAGVIAALGVFLVCPGRAPAPELLRQAYRTCLGGYEGCRYVWGGENWLGIDCSGLVRRALVSAQIRCGLLSRDAGLVRSGLDLWWHDCSARALRDGYGDYTRRLLSAASINAISNDFLCVGDLAVTADGIHVMAFLGERTWIEADPRVGRVVVLRAPSESPWCGVPVEVVRWRVLE